jgi:hypothetical protein
MLSNIVICSQKHRAVLAQIGASTFYDSYKDENSESDMQAYISNTYTIEKLAANLKDENIAYFLAYNETGDIGYVKLLLNQIPLLNIISTIVLQKKTQIKLVDTRLNLC